ncbi:MAG: XdhC/CoxI family protein [Dehalococcoidia bacterium]|nr:XdhC/CoxI family protein [Dehalococcoidia bacterium]
MENVFREAVRELESGKQGVLATVVRTKGSTPQKPGAKLWVREDGSAVGTLGGGCVEGDIWYAAKTMLRAHAPAEVREYLLNEEIAARDGLICGGTMYFLIDPVYQRQPVLSYAKEIRDAYDGGKTVALGTLAKAPKGSSAAVGAKVFFHENGKQEGTLGNSDLDSAVKIKARELMAYGKCEYLSLENGAEVFVEAYTTPPQLVLMGGGHISKALAPIAKILGFRIFVLDDRPEFANRDRFPEADLTVVGSYRDDLSKFPINSNTFVIIASRGHQYDDMATEAALRSKAGYIGLLGSRRKSILIFEEMFRKGIPEDRINSVHAPVGLDIGGRTPQEIAVSIIAEILAVRLGGSGAPMKMDQKLVQKAKEKALSGASR